MRNRGLLDGERALEIADADFATATNENIENGEPDRVGEELEISAHPLQGFQIDS